MTTTTTTATATFAQLADLVASGLQPEGRAAHIANTLRQEGEIAGDLPCTLGALKGAYEKLGKGGSDDEPGPVKGRRNTCSQMAALIQGPAETPTPAFAVWRAVQTHFAGSEDPRQCSIAERAGREAAELEQA